MKAATAQRAAEFLGVNQAWLTEGRGPKRGGSVAEWRCGEALAAAGWKVTFSANVPTSQRPKIETDDGYLIPDLVIEKDGVSKYVEVKMHSALGQRTAENLKRHGVVVIFSDKIGYAAQVVEESISNDAAPSPVAVPAEYANQASDLDADSSTSIFVDVFDARGSMGLGLSQPEHDNVVDRIRLARDWVRSQLAFISSPANLAVLSAYGDSMTPTFADGDILLVDRGVTEIRLDAVYVLSLNSELYVKRIQRRITDGAVIIKSDNPLYDPVVVDNGERENLSVLGRVVWAWNGRKL